MYNLYNSYTCNRASASFILQPLYKLYFHYVIKRIHVTGLVRLVSFNLYINYTCNRASSANIIQFDITYTCNRASSASIIQSSYILYMSQG